MNSASIASVLRPGGRVHFIGCGGAGMVGLAIILRERGMAVSGSDLVESGNTRLLDRRGVGVTIGHRPENLPSPGPDLLLVRSSAVRDDNPEFAAGVAAGSPHRRRGELLAALAATCRRTVSVAGSHGKTSVSALLAHVLREVGRFPGYCIGGKVIGWESPAAAGNGDLFICESDESDGTQVHLHSHLAVVVNLEDDHAWNFSNEAELYANFAAFARQATRLLHLDEPAASRLFADHPNRLPWLPTAADLAPFADLPWGPFQRHNAALVTAAAVQLGVLREEAVAAARSFPGVARRMTVHRESPGLVIVEDYAHHPTEVTAALAAFRERWPDRRLKVVFQPHRHARLARYFHDFARELRQADAVVVTPVFAAWTEVGPASPADLAAAIGPHAEFSDSPWPQLARELAATLQPPEALAILGAGDIDQVIAPLQAATDTAGTADSGNFPVSRD
jgi:UDP-N-acetylmuramate--alanine ligase